MVCDMTIAADNAIFGQTGPKVISGLNLYLPVYVVYIRGF